MEEECEISDKGDSCDVSEGRDSGEAGVGCDSCDVSEGRDSGDVSEGCDSGDVSEKQDSGDVSVMCDSGEGGGSLEAIGRVTVSQFGEFVSQHHAHGNKKFRDNFEVLTIACIAIHCV